jgi:hypothetical protein
MQTLSDDTTAANIKIKRNKKKKGILAEWKCVQVIKCVADKKVCAFYSLLFFTSLIPDAFSVIHISARRAISAVFSKNREGKTANRKEMISVQ